MFDGIKQIQVTALANEAPWDLQLELVFQSGKSKHIQFRLDQFTYTHLSKVVVPGYLTGENNQVICSLPVVIPEHETKSGTEWLLWEIYGQSTKLSFSCSQEFKELIGRLRKIRSTEEFQVMFLQPPTKEEHSAPGQSGENTTRRRRFFSRPLLPYTILTLGFLIFFCAAAITFLVVQWKTKEALAEEEIVYKEERLPLPPLVLDNMERDDKRDRTIKAQAPMGKLIHDLPQGQVALTFDDGPSVYTDDILQVLDDFGVTATFFFIGKNVARFPQEVENVREKGHSIGIHTYSHKNMRALSYEAQQEEIELCLEALKPYAEKISLLRPPYGAYNKDTEKAAHENNLTLALWNRDPRDWQAGSGQTVLRNFTHTSFEQGIYIFHENAKTLEVLPEIIEALQKEGLELVDLEPNEESNVPVSFAQL